MARNLSPKCKQCRRAGEKLFLKGERCDSIKCTLIRRKYPPGVHGPKQRIRLSEYGLQLREKQKAKKIYRLLERQFVNYVKKAIKHGGDAGFNLLSLLESRVDNILYKAGIAESRDAARQAVSHGLIKINNVKMNIPSCIPKIGDLIIFNNDKYLSKKLNKEVKNKKESKDFPSWFAFDNATSTIKILSEPDASDLPSNIDTRLIIEYYSR